MKKIHRITLKKNYQLLIFIIILFMSFVFINIGSGLLFGRYKADLTDSRKYTLSQSSKQIVKEIKSPVYIKVYLSQNLNKEYPKTAQYSQFVLRFMEKYQNLAPEMIEIEVKNPEPFSQTEKEAKQEGIEPFLNSNGQTNLYFGAVFSNENGDSYVIPRFLNERQNYLETDISRILAKINEPVTKQIGIVSDSLPMLRQTYADSSIVNWAFLEQLKNDYKLIPVSSKTVQIPLDIDALILINPGNIPALFMYALDQYIMGGGKILILSDPYSEVSEDLNGVGISVSANINKLLNNMGVTLNQDIVVGDLSLSEKTIISNKGDNQLRSFPLWMNIAAPYINQKHPVTQGLSRINFKSAGAIEIAPKHEAQITPLITTSPQAGSVSTDLLLNFDKFTIAEQYKETDISYNLGVLIEGKFDSLFTDNILRGTDFEEQMLPFIAHSIEPAEIIIISDSDILDETNWTADESAEDAGAYRVIPTANNGDLILRSIDYLTGNKQLLGINNKNVLDNDKTVSEEIYASAYNKFAEEYEQNKRSVNELSTNTQYLEEAVAEKTLGISMPLLQKIEQNKQEINKRTDNLKYMDYLIRQENEKQINTVIWLNILILPFSVIFVIWLINMYINAQKKKKVREIADEYKIS